MEFSDALLDFASVPMFSMLVQENMRWDDLS